MDWSHCPDVESVPDRLSGVPVVKGTRVQADAVIQHFDGGFSAEEIADEIFDLDVEAVRRVIDFARTHVAHPA